MEETRCECGANVSCECGPKKEPIILTPEDIRKTQIGYVDPKQDKKMFSEEEIRKTLTNLKLVNPAHITMTDSGHGEFPDGYKLIKEGVEYIIKKLKKNENK